MLLEDDELLPLFIKYMRSDDYVVMCNAYEVITNMINGGVNAIVRKVIQADHCIDYCIDAINNIEEEELVNKMIKALLKCIQVDRGLKELYICKNLKKKIKNNYCIDESSDEYQKLLSTLKKESKENEFVNKRRRKR